MATAWHHRHRMIPIVTPAEMAAIDAAAPEPVEVLIGRAGAAVARAAIEMLGGTYGRRVVVLAGKGNNGNDGRDAARRLRRRGVRVVEVDAHDRLGMLPSADLVIDAAFGTGFRGDWCAPETSTARARGRHPEWRRRTHRQRVRARAAGGAHRHVRRAEARALAAPGERAHGRDRRRRHRPRHEQRRTRGCSPTLTSPRSCPSDLRRRTSGRPRCRIAAGSPGMTGAAHLAARGAQRAGAGYVRLGTPGVDHDAHAPTEVVGHALPSGGWGRRCARRPRPLPVARRRAGLGARPEHALRSRAT